jgi:hypothetical protein
LFVTGDRNPDAAGLMFADSDRTRPLRERTALTSADIPRLVAANALKPTIAVTFREHQGPSTHPWHGSNRRTFAVASRERSHYAGLFVSDRVAGLSLKSTRLDFGPWYWEGA